MSCDISRVFHTLIRAIQTTSETDSKIAPRSRPIKSPNAFSFWNRAARLRSSLEVLADYLKRVQQLTATSVGNTFKQRVHFELTNQVTDLIEQCTALLIQLREVSRLDDHGQKLTPNQQQLQQHRQAICEALDGELTKLRRQRDAENDRQRHLKELTGSLASGVRSISPSRLKQEEVRSSTVGPDSSVLGPGQTSTAEDRDYPAVVRNWKQTSLSFTERELLNSRAVEQPELTDNEAQELELENRLLYHHLSSQREDITQVAKAITEIGRLNQTLSAHLIDQLEATQQISQNLTHATEDVSHGNEELRAALSNKASMQFWILFIMCVLTFSLHFLDWYYP